MKIFVTWHKWYLWSEFLKKYWNDYEIIWYDILDWDDLLDVKKLENKMKWCEQIVHLAAIPKPLIWKSFEDYFDNNVKATLNVANAWFKNWVKKIIYASSTTFYWIEKWIPFSFPIKEDQKIISQYLKSDDLKCREVDLSYHMSKVMAEQIMAWFWLNKKLQTIALRFWPIDKVFLWTSVSINNATQAIKLAIDCKKELWYEAFSVVDELEHIDINKIKSILWYNPEKPSYTEDQIFSTIDDRINLI